MKSIIRKTDYILGAILIVIGICAIILAFFNSPIQLQITVGLAGFGFICLGLLQFRKAHEQLEIIENLQRINTKLDEIKQIIQSHAQKGNYRVLATDGSEEQVLYQVDCTSVDCSS